ncbi:MAG: ABC transporter ATP-binding protein [Pirellulaceae bacterium]|jgi:lipoprotein-releasing system ATP-binding protein|nr:ABC transporter ATP-binding protein [Thermoguttaceae bacterium]MDI9444697.1 ABC transporter ATP-binding protein [Planctomycetota bacterium]NLY99618.1 ABC transporter ATP-binding protein [Pirellulaceae bacterium]
MSDLIVDHVTKEYPTRSDPLVVLRGVSFELQAGRNLAIVGPSGSGKTTLLNLLGALESATSGTIRLDGQNPATLSDKDVSAFRNHKIGFVFQEHHLLPQCSVLENVLIPTLAGGGTKASDIDRARQLLDRVGLGDRLEHRPAELSGGQRQRTAIARALIRLPVLVLADEPTGNLDQSTAAQVADLLLELQEAARNMLITVTHSAALARRMQRRVELDDGRLREVA